MNRFLIACLIGTIMLGVTLRTYRLHTPRFDNDEAFAWRVAIKPLPELLITAAGDTTPPAHYLLLKSWMNIWGTSPVALRSLSVLSGLFLIVAIYALVVEAAQWGAVSSRAVISSPMQVHAHSFGGVVAAMLAAIHSFQLVPNRTARMYGLGALLAVLTAWLLLRALRACCRPCSARDAETADRVCLLRKEPHRKYAWWIAYGACAALFLLTHHFALFTLTAQGAFALWCALVSRRPLTIHHSPIISRSPIEQRMARQGIVLAGTVALVLYSPWLPTGIAQVTRVSQSFWIAERSALEWGQTFVRWCVGIDCADTTFIAVCLAGSVLIVARTLVGSAAGHPGPTANPAAISLLTQAALPWIAIALFSTAADRPMLQDRYLAFSQASWLGLLGVVVASFSRPEWRVGVAVLFIVATLSGTQQFIVALPHRPPGIVQATERLARDYRAGAVIAVQHAPDVNCLKFHLSQHGMTDVAVRATIQPWPTSGHVNHVASLDSDEFLSQIEDLRTDVPQL